jgi:cytochrome c553
MARLIAPPSRLRFWLLALALLAVTLLFGVRSLASDAEKPVKRDYSAVFAAPAPETQTKEEAAAKSAGCITCHTASDAWTMHRTEGVVLGCTDCHGGNANGPMFCRAIRIAGAGLHLPTRNGAIRSSTGNRPNISAL